VLEELPFDQYQRYGALALAADWLRARRGRPLRILDVGDWNGLAARFCPADDVLCLDPSGAGRAGYLVADGEALPFGDRSFDLVACLDMLEHVARGRRLAIVDELRRVADRALVVAVPIADDGAPAYEQELAAYVRDYLGGEQQQLREHAAHGLPNRAEARGWVEQAGWEHVAVSSGLLTDWLAMMVAKHSLLAVADAEDAHRAFDRRYNCRHGPVDPASPAYRLVLFAARAGADAALPADLVGTLRPVRHVGDAEDAAVARTMLLGAHARRAGASIDLATLIDPDPRGLARASRALDAVVRRRVDGLSAQVEALSERVAAFERGRFIRLMGALAGLRRRLAR
jgi:SAM-dependent methyltransferase